MSIARASGRDRADWTGLTIFCQRKKRLWSKMRSEKLSPGPLPLPSLQRLSLLLSPERFLHLPHPLSLLLHLIPFTPRPSFHPSLVNSAPPPLPPLEPAPQPPLHPSSHQTIDPLSQPQSSWPSVTPSSTNSAPDPPPGSFNASTIRTVPCPRTPPSSAIGWRSSCRLMRLKRRDCCRFGVQG